MATQNAYGRSMDIEGSGAICPPDGFYNLRVKGVTDPEERPGFSGGDIDIQSRINVEIFGFSPSEDDEDDYDWNGEVLNMFGVWARKPGGHADKVRPLFKSAKATSGKLMRALYPDVSEAEWAVFILDLDDLKDREFKCFISEKANGYPQFDKFTAYRRKTTRKAKPAAVPEPQPDPETDDAELDDDELFEEGDDD